MLHSESFWRRAWAFMRIDSSGWIHVLNTHYKCAACSLARLAKALRLRHMRCFVGVHSYFLHSGEKFSLGGEELVVEGTQLILRSEGVGATLNAQVTLTT